jgi:DNA-binding SARP family transcriptional activator
MTTAIGSDMRPVALAAARTRGARIAICGALMAEIRGRQVDALLPGRKGRQLFACLVVSRERPMTRDELIDAIWPVSAPVDPDGALSTLLTRVRAALGPGVVRGRGELLLDVGDDPWIDWDVARGSVGTAEKRLADGDPLGALTVAHAGLDIARLSLLPGVETPWVEDRRREMVEARVALLETAGRAAVHLGGEHLPAAERSARELIACEPYRESAYALLMEIHAARGNIAEALRVFDDLRRLLREELGLTPAPHVMRLAAELLEQKESARAAAPSSAVTPTASSSPDGPSPLPPSISAVAARMFAGGEARLRRVLAAVERTTSCPAVVALTGEPGIGKTRLAAELAVRAHRAGHEVLHGRAGDDATTPGQPFVEALRHHLAHCPGTAREVVDVLGPELGELARFVPELRAVAAPAGATNGDDPTLRGIVHAVTGLFAAIARRRPLLLVLEDLHAADRETLTLLRSVVGDHARRVTVLVTLRDDETPPPALRRLLLDLLRERLLDRIAVPALDAAETAEVIAGNQVATEDRRRVDAIHALAGGNPFYTEELVRAGANDAGLPRGLREALDVRLDALPPSTRRALAAAAATGRSFDVGTVARRTQANPGTIRAALAPAARTGILIAEDECRGRFSFRHGVVRRALLTP